VDGEEVNVQETQVISSRPSEAEVVANLSGVESATELLLKAPHALVRT
jgi:hypothetical protein